MIGKTKRSIPALIIPQFKTDLSVECGDWAFTPRAFQGKERQGEPKLCQFEKDLPAVSRPDGYEDRYLPFHVEQIGDPMRGTVKQQFDQYFPIECSKYTVINSD